MRIYKDLRGETGVHGICVQGSGERRGLGDSDSPSETSLLKFVNEAEGMGGMGEDDVISV